MCEREGKRVKTDERKAGCCGDDLNSRHTGSASISVPQTQFWQRWPDAVPLHAHAYILYASHTNATQAAAFWSQTATVSCTQSVTVWRCPSTKHTTTRTKIKQTSRQALSAAYLFTTSLVRSNYLHLFCQSVFDGGQCLPFITQSFPSVYFNTPAFNLCIWMSNDPCFALLPT